MIGNHKNGRKYAYFHNCEQDGDGEIANIFGRIIKIKDNPQYQKRYNVVKNRCRYDTLTYIGIQFSQIHQNADAHRQSCDCNTKPEKNRKGVGKMKNQPDGYSAEHWNQKAKQCNPHVSSPDRISDFLHLNLHARQYNQHKYS